MGIDCCLPLDIDAPKFFRPLYAFDDSLLPSPVAFGGGSHPAGCAQKSLLEERALMWPAACGWVMPMTGEAS